MPRVQLNNGIDPLNPDVIREMQNGKANIEKQFASPGCLVEPDDLTDGLVIAGFQARPLSAGMLAVLEMIHSPLFGKGGQDEEAGEKDVAFQDMLVLLFLLLGDAGDMELVELAGKGYEAMTRAAVAWSFRLEISQFAALQRELPRLLETFARTMELYGDAGRDDDKKK